MKKRARRPIDGVPWHRFHDRETTTLSHYSPIVDETQRDE